MIRTAVVLAALATTLFALNAAASRAALLPTVVGTVDLPAVLEKLDEMAAEVERSRKAGEAFQVELAKRNSELEALEADLDDFVPGTDQYQEAEKAMTRASIDLRAFMGLADLKEARTKRRSILRIYRHIKESLSGLADQEGFDLVLMDDSAVPIPEESPDVLNDISGRRVLYARPTIDVTSQLIEYMNAQWQAAKGS